jgi:uncharacterized lipoprotein YmbA
MNSNTRREIPVVGETKRALGRFAAAAFLLAALAGCSIIPEPTPDPTRYYLLGEAAPTQATTMAATNSPAEGALHVGLRGVDLPAYLRSGRSIVVRKTSNEVRYEEYARWAEPLDAAVLRAVREKLLATDRIATADTPPFVGETKRDLDISIRVLRCEGTLSENGKGGVQFVATYDVYNPSKGGALVLRRTFVGPPAAWNGSNFGELVQRLSDAVSALGADIAENLPTLR